MLNPTDFDPITAYYQGVIDAIILYAVWKDGEQVVGVLQKPLQNVLEEVKHVRKNALEINKIIQFGWE